MELNPLHDRVVVSVQAVEKKTASGIVIPDSATDTPNTGTVVAAGPGKNLLDGTFVPVTVVVDNTVIFVKGAGQEVKLEGNEYTILKEEEILAVVNTGETA